MELERGTLGPDAEGHVLEDPAAVDPVGHDGVDAERRGDGRALEELALAGGVLGERRHGDVEAREAREAAEHEEGQAEGVDDGAQADGEGHHRGGDAE